MPASFCRRWARPLEKPNRRQQGLVTVSTGPAGGATIGEVPLERAFQLLQNYLFFREMDVAQIYAVRRLLEPELAAGAVPHLTQEHFEALERSIATCAPQPASKEEALMQRQEDLHFHDVLAAANPNMLLRFMCQVINHLLRHSVAMNNRPGPMAYQQLGETNVAAHKRLLAAARRGDVERVRKLMVAHIDEAERHVRKLDGAVRRRFVLDSELQARIAPQSRTLQEGEGVMTRPIFDRRQAILGMGAALMMSAAKQAVAADGDFAARLAEMERDGRVSGLHALLVSRGGRLLFEYYGVGEDERLGHAARQGHVRPDGAARSALGDQEPGRHALWHRAGRRQGAAAGSQALRPVPRVSRPGQAAGPRPHHRRPCAQHDRWATDWDELTYPVRRSAQQRERDGGGARSLSLHPVSADRRRAGREMDLLRRLPRRCSAG